jgi:cholesterol transport system auxiliary component
VLALALSGCISLGGGKVPDTLLTLTPEAAAPAGASSSGNAADALVVLEPETDRRLAVQRLAVGVDASNVAYMEKAMWVERPSRLFRALVAETIRARGTRMVFEDDTAVGGGRTRLAGRLRDIGFDGPTGAVIVRYDAILEGPGTTIATKRFEARVEGVEPNAAAVGPALNRAANDVARQVADWVR